MPPTGYETAKNDLYKLCCKYLEYFSSWRFFKLKHRLKSHGDFLWSGKYFLVLELHQGGFATNRATPSSFIQHVYDYQVKLYLLGFLSPQTDRLAQWTAAWECWRGKDSHNNNKLKFQKYTDCQDIVIIFKPYKWAHLFHMCNEQWTS